MSILSITGIVKRYHNHLAVDSVSFDMPRGSILGLLGPNGAGKTSLIRIITTITRPDQGRVLFAGEPLSQNHQESIGYLPEERGLYRKMKAGEQLIYLAQLKGVPSGLAKEKISAWFERLDMVGWWNKRIEELSKGMQQKVQLVSTLVHEPALLILDEPFSGLDPVNTGVMKEVIKELNAQGTSIIFSTHRMEQVEEICQNIVLINHGRNILGGALKDIKEQYKQHLFRIRYEGTLPDHMLEGIDIQQKGDQEVVVHLSDLVDANRYVAHLISEGVLVSGFSEILPTLNEIFIRKVTGAV